MKVNLSIDTSLTIGHYVIEASFWLRDWRLTAETHSSSAIKVLQIGPLCLCITNMKKLKELYLSGEADVVSLDDLADM
jgi:hypothetical protein